MFTDDKIIISEAHKALWLFPFNIFPDLFKGMLKGVIYALGIQYKAVYVHMITHWMVYPLAVWYFTYYLDLGIVGLWLGKITLEYSILILYTYIIS
jgi:Na+-driven multidrug efflux pump